MTININGKAMLAGNMYIKADESTDPVVPIEPVTPLTIRVTPEMRSIGMLDGDLIIGSLGTTSILYRKDGFSNDNKEVLDLNVSGVGTGTLRGAIVFEGGDMYVVTNENSGMFARRYQGFSNTLLDSFEVTDAERVSGGAFYNGNFHIVVDDSWIVEFDGFSNTEIRREPLRLPGDVYSITTDGTVMFAINNSLVSFDPVTLELIETIDTDIDEDSVGISYNSGAIYVGEEYLEEVKRVPYPTQ